jgi:hypothetical protein
MAANLAGSERFPQRREMWQPPDMHGLRDG